MRQSNEVIRLGKSSLTRRQQPWMNWKERSAEITAAFLIAAGAMTGALTTVWPTAPVQNVPVSPVPLQAQETPNSEQLIPDTPAATVVQQTKIHTVLAGETLSGIAAKYGVDVNTLLSANPEASDLILPGDKLNILPEQGILHVVEEGDTLWDLANQYGVATDIIMKHNKKNNDLLAVGEKIFVPGGRYRAVQTVSRAVHARFVWPTVGEFSSAYGYRWGRIHAGIDIANDIGTSIRAARAGRVSSAGWQSGYGYTIVIDHSNGYSTLYAHLNDFAISQGQYVQTGQMIGYMGSTGNSTGPHLHFEVRVNDKPVNPMSFLN